MPHSPRCLAVWRSVRSEATASVCGGFTQEKCTPAASRLLTWHDVGLGAAALGLSSGHGEFS